MSLAVLLCLVILALVVFFAVLNFVLDDAECKSTKKKRCMHCKYFDDNSSKCSFYRCSVEFDNYCSTFKEWHNL